MNFPLFLALRFLRGAQYEKTLSTMIRICFFSIMIGTGALTLIAAIMQGFEEATHKKLQGVHADLVIATEEGSIDYKKLSQLLTKNFSHAVKASSPSSFHHVMLQVESSPGNSKLKMIETTICLLKSIDPALEPQVSNLTALLTSSTGTPWKNLTDSTIYMGKSLAKRLGLTLGSEVSLLYQADEASQSPDLKKIRVTITGLYSTGIHDYDDQILLASHELVDQLFSERITHVSLALKPGISADNLKHELSSALKLEVCSWKDLYPSLVAALTLEKYVMWIILLLVALVACLTIVSLLYMYATYKKTDLALLKALGMKEAPMRQTLVWIAGIVTLSATTGGIILAALGTWLLNAYPFISLPDVYIVTTVPAHLTLSIIASVYGIALLVSTCAGYFPNSALKKMQIASLLKGIEL